MGRATMKTEAAGVESPVAEVPEYLGYEGERQIMEETIHDFDAQHNPFIAFLARYRQQGMGSA